MTVVGWGAQELEKELTDARQRIEALESELARYRNSTLDDMVCSRAALCYAGCKENSEYSVNALGDIVREMT